MKALSFFLFLVLTATSSCYGFDHYYTPATGYAPIDWSRGWGAEFRMAYFQPCNRHMRKIYSRERYDLEAELSKDLHSNVQIFANVSWFHKYGKSVGLREKTKIKFIPISVGLKYVEPLNYYWNLYIGLGPNYTWLKVVNQSKFVRPHVHKQCFGATAKFGIDYKIREEFIIDFFVDYLFIPMRLKGVYNIGGFRAGIGVGFHP